MPKSTPGQLLNRFRKRKPQQRLMVVSYTLQISACTKNDWYTMCSGGGESLSEQLPKFPSWWHVGNSGTYVHSFQKIVPRKLYIFPFFSWCCNFFLLFNSTFFVLILSLLIAYFISLFFPSFFLFFPLFPSFLVLFFLFFLLLFSLFFFLFFFCSLLLLLRLCNS